MRVKLLSLIILSLLIGVSQSFGAEKTTEDVGIEKTIETITYILKKGLPKYEVYPWRRHPLLRNKKQMRRISKAIYNASILKKIPVSILITTGFREGSFRPGSRGKIGEESMFQMVPRIAREAQKLEPLCTLKTIEGSAICSATWLGYWKDKCGNWKGSFSKYATGKTCKPVNNRVRWLSNNRFKISKTLNKKFWSVDTSNTP